MNHQEKKEIIKQLNERDFRQDIIIPLLSKMGYLAPTEYHGTNERGKDIICFEYDRLNEQRFLAVVAKADDLTGNAAKDTGLMTVVNQIQQAFDCPYEDLFNMRQVFINEVWVMTTGKIVSGAQESVINTLRKTNLDKQIRIIGDDRLIELIDKHFSTYWNSTTETKESVIIQRDRLLSFIEKLLAANNVDREIIENVKSTILYSSYEPRIKSNIEGLHIGHVSPYSIELAKIDAEFDDYIVSKTYGVTKRIFHEAKEQLRCSFFDIEEVIDHADKISKLTDPWEFVVQADGYLLREDPFHRPYGTASKFVSNIGYMEEGLRELKNFKGFLKEQGKLNWVKELSKSIVDLEPEIKSIIANSKEERLIFLFAIDNENNIVKLLYNEAHNNAAFKIDYKRVDANDFRRQKDGTITTAEVIGMALLRFREYIESLLGFDDSILYEE